MAATKQQLRVTKEKATSRAVRRATNTRVDNQSKTDGIDLGEITRRKSTGECLRYAWPPDRKGTHKVKDCIRPIKLDIGTAQYPKSKKCLRTVDIKSVSEDESSDDKEDSSEEE